jgi:hypothetical protein
MTELATPPVEREQDVKWINHWIGGRTVEGTSGRSGPVYNPARGIQTGAVDFATVEEVDQAVQAAKEAFPAWRTMSLSKRTAIFFAVRELVDEHREGSRAVPDGGAQQGPVGCDGRGGARSRGDRVLLRHPRALEGRVHRAGVDRDRRVFDPAAARRRRGDHAVQFPRDGAHVDVGACPCVRQHVRAEAVRGGREPGRSSRRWHEMTAWTPATWADAIAASPFDEVATYDGGSKGQWPRVDAFATGGLLWHGLVC